MPNNENNPFNNESNNSNNNFFNLPTENNLENQKQSDSTQQKIEIPQRYYDQLEAEKQAKLAEEQRTKMLNEELANSSKTTHNIFLLAILSTIVIFGCLYLIVNKTQNAIYVLTAYIVIGAIYSGIKNKKDSNFGLGLLIGGILSAIVTFVISMFVAGETDLWTYYAFASGVVGIVGIIIANLITLICYNHKNIKALETIGIFLVFAVIVCVPIYLSKKYPQEFAQYVFYAKTEVVAQTEEEFIIKTLKNRYDVTFTCGTPKNFINHQKRLVTTRTCTDQNTNNIQVTSTVYNETEKKYIVQEDYLEVLYITNFKNKLEKNLSSATNTTVEISLYPKDNCEFIGDCINWEAGTLKDQYNVSSTLELKQYINLDETSFINKFGFKYYINITGSFANLSEADYINTVNNVLTSLNNLNIKNTNGFEISIIDSALDLKTTVYKATGETNQNQSFTI